MRLKLLLFRHFRACPPFHTFCKYFGVYKKERKHEIERQLLVHMFTLSKNEIHEVEIIFLEFSELVHLSTLFAKILKKERKLEIGRQVLVYMSTHSNKEKHGVETIFLEFL